MNLSLLHSSITNYLKVHVYLWADVLGNQSFATDRLTPNRRDAILAKQIQISIFLKQILRQRVPGLTPEQSEVAYVAFHRFMHTNSNLPFLM